MLQSMGSQRVGTEQQRNMENSAQVNVAATTGHMESQLTPLPEHEAADSWPAE